MVVSIKKNKERKMKKIGDGQLKFHENLRLYFKLCQQSLKAL